MMFKNLLHKILPSERSKACYAPFQSLRFNHSGNVLACCYNRGNVLGKFPEQTISEIWFGSNVSQLQKAISKNDFSLGCHSCEKELSYGNREISGASQYDYLKNQKQHKNFPTMFDFELGSTCNFECIMCSGEYSTAIRVNREKQKPYYSSYEENPQLFVDQLTPFIPHLKEMRFIGGEPFLMKVYYDIWDRVLELNPEITLNVLTNGSILNKRVQSMLKKGNFKIAVSIDSLVKETYEEIRKNGNFNQVMSNIEFFLKLMNEQGYTMSFNLCVMRQNWKEIPDYFHYCNENNIQVVLHTVQFPNHCSIWNLPAQELSEILKLYNDVPFIETNDIQTNNTNTYKALVAQIQNWHLNALKHSEKEENSKVLEGKLIDKIKNEQKYPNFNPDTDYAAFVMDLIGEFTNDEKTIILNYLNKINVRLVIDEINVSSKERMLERIKVIIQNPQSI